jgi:phenylpyruvate tautomerase PptA (4-oxalocrotonate tautomerase family)
MPIIQIKSLPFKQHLELKEVIEQLSRRFSSEMDISPEYITVTWEYYLPGHYAHSGKAIPRQDPATHPLMVELFTPDVHTEEMIGKMFECIANILSEETEVNFENIFITHHEIHSGQVFDGGNIVKW